MLRPYSSLEHRPRVDWLYSVPADPNPMQRRVVPFVLVCVTLVLVLVAGVFLVAERPRVYAPRGPGDIYLALGDSLAWGFSLENRAVESYPGLIHTQLAQARPIELANLSVPGETTSSFTAGQLPRAVEFIRTARQAGKRVSPITLDIGGNDLRRVERAGPSARAEAIAAARRNIASSLDQLRAAVGADSDIAVMTYYNPYGGDATQESSDGYWVEQLNQVIREEAGRRGVAVADVYPEFLGGRFYTHTFILLGDIHANAQGHAVIAQEFFSALGYR